MDHLTPLTPDEALYAFMDGELELPEEQRLFDELAAKPDLRTEMKDILSIRGAVHKDVIFPSPGVETSLLAAAGLALPAGATASAVGAAAAFSSSWFRPLLTTLGGAIAGGVIVYFMMLGSGAVERTSTDLVGVTGGTSTERPTMQMLVPVRRDTVVVNRYVPARQTVVPVAPSVATPPQQNIEADLVNSEITTSPMRTRPSAQDLDMSPTYNASTTMAETITQTDRSSLPQVTLRVRSLPNGLSAGDVAPSSTLFANGAFALLFPLSDHQHLGIEMGQETWPQTYQGTVNGMPVEYRQAPALFWIGATYRHAFAEFNFLDGLRPFAEITGAYAWSQGPLGRAQGGLSYQPSQAIAFNLGIDGAVLNYNNEGRNFTSFKWGVTYGIVINMGSLR